MILENCTENAQYVIDSTEWKGVESHGISKDSCMRRLQRGWDINHIDLAANEIHICRNATYAKNQAIVGTPKTKSGFRDIPLFPDLLAYLLPVKERGYVIGGNDKPISLIAFRRMWERIDKTINLHGATPHVFRHTMGTLLNDVGADVKTIQSVLGQRDFKTTADRYVHSRNERKQEAALKVSDLLKTKG